MTPRPPGVFVIEDLFQIAARQHDLCWLPFQSGVDVYEIYREPGDGPAAVLLRFEPGARIALHEHQGFEHIIVLAGSQSDDVGSLRTGGLMISRPGTKHNIVSKEGCIVLAIYQRNVRFLADGQ